jgi:hypothetical protein
MRMRGFQLVELLFCGCCHSAGDILRQVSSQASTRLPQPGLALAQRFPQLVDVYRVRGLARTDVNQPEVTRRKTARLAEVGGKHADKLVVTDDEGR